MKENLNYQNKEEIVGEYDQFDTEETFHQNKKIKYIFTEKIDKIHINNFCCSLPYAFNIIKFNKI